MQKSFIQLTFAHTHATGQSFLHRNGQVIGKACLSSHRPPAFNLDSLLATVPVQLPLQPLALPFAFALTII
jgi:hypothetical protein